MKYAIIILVVGSISYGMRICIPTNIDSKYHLIAFQYTLTKKPRMALHPISIIYYCFIGSVYDRID